MKSPRLMFAYAGFLVACGAVAYFMAPAGAKAGTALIVSSGAAALMVICASMAGAIHRNPTVGMIGIHTGLVLPLVFAALFAFRAYSTFANGGEAKRYLAVILSIMAIGSVVAFIAILASRPPKAARIA
jgi:uncharacterized membrane protein